MYVVKQFFFLLFFSSFAFLSLRKCDLLAQKKNLFFGRFSLKWLGILLGSFSKTHRIHCVYYEYEISSILSNAHTLTSFILAGKRDSRRHSTTSFSENVVVAERSYQI